jgi:sporulation integral membrane protein YtvI
MNKLKLNRKISAIILFTVVLTVIVGSLVWGITVLVSESTNLLSGLNIYADKIYLQIQKIIENMDFSRFHLPNEIISIIQSSTGEILYKISSWVSEFLTKLIDFITSLPAMIIYLIVTILALYFMCTDKIYIIDQMEHHLPKTWVKNIGVHFKEITKSLGGYLKAQLILIMVSFFISLVGLYAYMFAGFNIKYPLLIAIGIGFVDALPILGSGTVMVPWAVLVAINGDIKLGMAILILWIIMSIVRQLLEPRIVSNKIGVHPIFTLIAMYTGFKIVGVIGMLIGPIILIILKNIFGALLDEGIFKWVIEK